MSDSSLHPLGSADGSGYFTGRPRNDPPRAETEEDPSECPGSDNEVSSREIPRQDTRVAPTPVPPQPPRVGLRPRVTARMSVRPPAIRDFPPGTGPSGTVPPETVSGIPISRDPNMTFWIARRVDSITHELHDHRVSLAHHSQMLGHTVDLTERLIYRVSEAQDVARVATCWCRTFAVLLILVAAVLAWIVMLRE